MATIERRASGSSREACGGMNNDQNGTEKQSTSKASHVNGATEQQEDVLRTVRKRAVSHGATHSRQAVGSLAQDGTAPPADESRRERALRLELETAKRQVAFLPFLKEKFDALVTEHAESKARYNGKATTLKEQVTELETRSKSQQKDHERLRAEILAKSSEVTKLGSELGRLRSAKGEVEQHLKESKKSHQEEVERCQELKAHIVEQHLRYEDLSQFSHTQTDTLGKHASKAINIHKLHNDASNSRLKDRLASQSWLRFKLERKIAEKEDQVTQLVELILQSEDEQSLSETRIEDLEDDILRIERSLASESRLFRNERRALLEQLDEQRLKMEDLSSIHDETRIQWDMERDMMLRDARIAAATISSQAEAIRELQGVSLAKFEVEQQLDETQGELEEAVKTIIARDEDVEHLHADLQALSDGKDSLSNELASTHDSLKLAEQDLTNERAQRRHLSSLLVQSQVTETQLQEEVFTLQNDLVSYLQLQETHADLIKNLDRLMRTADLAEEDAKELARMNSELAGHNNPNQRIRQLDRLRNELSELKKKYITSQADLTSHKSKISALEAEVSAYKSLDEQRPKIVKHVQPLKNSTNIMSGRGSDMPLGNAGFGHVSVRKANSQQTQQVDQSKAARIFGQQRGPVKSFLS